MGLLDNLNFSQPFSLSSLLPSEAQLQAYKQKSDAEAIAQYSQDPNPVRRVPFNILTALGVNPTLAKAAPTVADVAPITGDASAIADARTAFGQGDYLTGGLLSMAALPFVPSIVGKGKGLLKQTDDAKPLLNVDTAPKQGIEYIPPTDNSAGIIAFHGSPHDFDKFRIDKINTGEGNQAFGYGLYFTDSEDIAKFYKNSLSDDMTSDTRYLFKGQEYERGSPEWKMLATIYNDGFSGANKLLKAFKSDLAKGDPYISADQVERYEAIINQVSKKSEISKNQGRTYKVALAPKPDELLDYDLPFGQQNKFIKERLSKVANEMTVDDAINLGFDPFDFGNNNQAAINAAKKEMLKDDQSVVAFLNNWAVFRGEQGAGEKLLNKHGIKGIKYLDNASRNTFGGKLLGINKLDDGQFQARIVLDDPNRQTGLGGSGRVITTSKPYKTQKEAEDWANKEMGNRQSNYVIFDENLINILAKYGIVGGVGITALQNSDI